VRVAVGTTVTDVFVGMAVAIDVATRGEQEARNTASMRVVKNCFVFILLSDYGRC
jgi:hypothetical protein